MLVREGISAISSVGENQNEHKGASRSQRELERLASSFLPLPFSLSLSLPPFFPPNVEKSILELSFRFVSFRGCSAAVSPRLFRSSRAFVPALLRFPDRFSSIVGNYGTHCPVSLFSREHGENGGTMYRADKRKWAEKGRRPRRGMISAVRFFVCFENRDSFLPDRGKRRIVCNFVSSNITILEKHLNRIFLIVIVLVRMYNLRKAKIIAKKEGRNESFNSESHSKGIGADSVG